MKRLAVLERENHAAHPTERRFRTGSGIAGEGNGKRGGIRRNACRPHRVNQHCQTAGDAMMRAYRLSLVAALFNLASGLCWWAGWWFHDCAKAVSR